VSGGGWGVAGVAGAEEKKQGLTASAGVQQRDVVTAEVLRPKGRLDVHDLLHTPEQRRCGVVGLQGASHPGGGQGSARAVGQPHGVAERGQCLGYGRREGACAACDDDQHLRASGGGTAGLLSPLVRHCRLGDPVSPDLNLSCSVCSF